MNLYEHTIIAKQDVSPSQIKQLIEKYSKIILNPGSVGQARDIKGKAAWATLDKKNFKVDFFYEKYNKEKLLQLVKKIEQQNHYNYRALI